MGWFGNSSAARVLTGKSGKRGKLLAAVTPGSTFRRVHADRLEETAKVLAIAKDPYGIPHVRFRVSFRRPNRNFFDGGARMLALESFADHYSEEVPEPIGPVQPEPEPAV